MKASELIRELQALVEEHGDLDVNQESVGFGDRPVLAVMAYDKEGFPPETSSNQPVEFYIH